VEGEDENTSTEGNKSKRVEGEDEKAKDPNCP